MGALADLTQRAIRRRQTRRAEIVAALAVAIPAGVATAVVAATVAVVGEQAAARTGGT
jgi:hypothetical protein